MTEPTGTNPSLQLILTAAEDLIREKGCRATTLQEIISRTGLSKGAIYHYVSSKDELFGLILQNRLKAMNRDFQEAVARAVRDQDPSAPFLAIAEGLSFSRSENHPFNSIFIYLLSQKENPAIAGILEQLQRNSREITINWIKAGQQGKAIPPSVDAEKMADLLLIFNYGLRVHNMISPPSLTLDTPQLLTIIMTALQHK